MASNKLSIDSNTVYVTPPKTRTTTPLCGAPEPIAVSREGTPASLAEDNNDLDSFDWSKLNTPKSLIRSPERKPDESIIAECNEKLATLSEDFDNPDGLKALIDGLNTIVGQEWTALTLYFDYDADFPNDEKLWVKVEWRKCNIVDFITCICYEYHEAFEMHSEDLDAKYVDQEFGSLLNDLSVLGMKAMEKTVEIKEWERVGTKALMEVEGLHVDHLVEDDDEDDDDDGEGDV